MQLNRFFWQELYICRMLDGGSGAKAVREKTPYEFEKIMNEIEQRGKVIKKLEDELKKEADIAKQKELKQKLILEWKEVKKDCLHLSKFTRVALKSAASGDVRARFSDIRRKVVRLSKVADEQIANYNSESPLKDNSSIMRKYDLNYQLESEEIKVAAMHRTKDAGLQFMPAMDLTRQDAVDLNSNILAEILSPEEAPPNFDFTKPIYMPMVIAEHDVLLAFVPTPNGLQPLYVDSLGQRADDDLRKKIALEVVKVVEPFFPHILPLKDISVDQQVAQVCGLAAISNIESIDRAFKEGKEVNSSVLYQGVDKEKYFQELGDELVDAAILPAKEEKPEEFKARKAEGLKPFLKMRLAIEQGKSVVEIEKMLSGKEFQGFDIARSEIDRDNNKVSLLQSALVGGNFEVFKWLVETKKLDMAKSLSAIHDKFNTASPEKDLKKAAGAKQILQYIDAKLSVKDKSEINLLVMAAYYMDVALCRKLIGDGVDINLKGRRGAAALAIAASNSEKESLEILDMLLADKRISIGGSNVITAFVSRLDVSRAISALTKFPDKFPPEELKASLKMLIQNIGGQEQRKVDDKTSIAASKLYLLLLAAYQPDAKQNKDLKDYSNALSINPEFKSTVETYHTAYNTCNNIDRKATLEMLKRKDAMLDKFIDIVSDPTKLADFVNKLDSDELFRERYKDLKADKGIFFPLGIIDAKLKEIEQSRGFFARLFKRIQDWLLPSKLLEADYEVFAINVPAIQVKESTGVEELEFKNQEYIEKIKAKIEELKKLDEENKANPKLASIVKHMESVIASDESGLGFEWKNRQLRILLHNVEAVLRNPDKDMKKNVDKITNINRDKKKSHVGSLRNKGDGSRGGPPLASA